MVQYFFFVKNTFLKSVLESFNLYNLPIYTFNMFLYKL